MTINTPSNLEVLLYCYYSAEVHPRYSTQAVQEGLQYLLDNDMIRPNEDATKTHYVTDKGIFYIKHLMVVPFPVNTWSIPS